MWLYPEGVQHTLSTIKMEGPFVLVLRNIQVVICGCIFDSITGETDLSSGVFHYYVMVHSFHHMASPF